MKSLMSPFMHESYHHTRIYPHCRNWLRGFPCRIPIILTGGLSGAQSDYQIQFDISYETAMQPNFNDVRFTQIDGKTLIDGWLESKIDSTSAKVWVETDTPANSIDDIIYMYYGNSGVANYWDIGATFLFGDDFHGTNFDPQWTSVDGHWSVSGGNAVHSVAGAGTWDQLAAANIVADGIMTTKMKISNDGVNDQLGIFTRSDGNYDDAHTIQFVSRLNVNDFNTYDWGFNEGACVNPFGYDTWHYLKMIFDGVNIKTSYSVDGSSFTDCKNFTTTHTTENDIGFRAIQATSYIDWIYIRKYAANPATYAFGSEERY